MDAYALVPSSAAVNTQHLIDFARQTPAVRVAMPLEGTLSAYLALSGEEIGDAARRLRDEFGVDVLAATASSSPDLVMPTRQPPSAHVGFVVMDAGTAMPAAVAALRAAGTLVGLAELPGGLLLAEFTAPTREELDASIAGVAAAPGTVALGVGTTATAVGLEPARG